MAQYRKLKDNHPTMIKLMKLYDLAEELGITLHFNGNTCDIVDRDRHVDAPPIRVYDLEDNNNSMSEFPPTFEFALRIRVCL